MAGIICADTLQDGAGNSTAMDNAIYGSAKAWVTFNGVTTTTILASYSISSVTRNSAGNYTVNFTNAFVDANYVVVCSASTGASDLRAAYPNFSTAPATSSCQIVTMNTTGTTQYDTNYVRAAFFR